MQADVIKPSGTTIVLLALLALGLRHLNTIDTIDVRSVRLCIPIDELLDLSHSSIDSSTDCRADCRCCGANCLSCVCQR